MANPCLIGETDKNSFDGDEEHRARVVLAVYTAVMASSRNERGAFEAAVETYRSEIPDLPEEDVRRAVAQIICAKPL